jgi:hypothetical protein
MSATGFVYIPSECSGGTILCKLHIVFHGCKQGVDTVGEVFVRNAGYNDHAEANGIVVL